MIDVVKKSAVWTKYLDKNPNVLDEELSKIDSSVSQLITVVQTAKEGDAIEWDANESKFINATVPSRSCSLTGLFLSDRSINDLYYRVYSDPREQKLGELAEYVQELVAVVKALNSAVQEISQQVDACARTQMAGFKQIMATIQGLDLSSPDSSEYNELESKIRAPFSAGTGHLPKFSMDLIAHLRELKVECKDLKVGAERAKKQLDSARDETSTTIELG